MSYSVDASGLRTQIAETRPNPTASQPAITRTTDYQYDAVKRLTREQVTGTQSQGRTTVFTYDKVGNRKTEATSGTLSKNQTLTYDNNDRLTRVAGTGGTIDHVYDNAGNLIEKKQGTTTLERYTFDAEGRLTAATIGTGASQKVLSYRYDPNGIRRSQHVETSTGQARTEYLVDPNQAYAQVLEEYETQAATGQALPASTLATTYVYGDDLISQTQLALAGNTTHVYHYDGLGTTRALSAHNLDAQGNPVTTGPNAHATITDRYAYTAFGENDPAGTSGNTAGSTDNNYRYTGEQLDPNLGFYYLRARYMDPRQGRFVGMDPWAGEVGDPLTLHRYLYASLNPAMVIDPTGLISMLMTTGNVNIGTAVSINIARTAFSRTFVGAALQYGVRAIKHEVRLCLRTLGRKCRLRIPIIWAGRDLEQQRLHIDEAQEGSGENLGHRRLPAVLNYQNGSINRKSWPKRTFPSGFSFSTGTPLGLPSCTKPKDILRRTAELGTSALDCDEYPFNASMEGGYRNYKAGKVSARFIPTTENVAFGAWISIGTRGLKKGDNYLVVAYEDLPISGALPK